MITVFSKELLKVMTDLYKIVPQKPVIPVLSTFRFRRKAGVVSVSACDSEIGVTLSLPSGDEGEDEQFCVTAKTILDLTKTLPACPLFLTPNDNDSVTIRWPKGESTLPMFKADDFVETAVPDKDANSACVNAGSLAAEMKKILPAVVEDEIRPALGGVCMDFGKNSLTLVGTDAKRLFVSHADDVTCVKEHTFILPRKAASLLSSVFTTSEEKLACTSGVNSVLITSENFEMRARLIVGKFPKYKTVIPSGGATAVLDRDELTGIVRRTSVCDSTNVLARMEFTRDKVTVTAQDSMAGTSAKEALDITYSGEDLTVGFKASFLLDAIAALTSEKVEMLLSEGNRPALITSHEDEAEHFRGVVIPYSLS